MHREQNYKPPRPGRDFTQSHHPQYGIAPGGQRAIRLKLHFRDGRRFSLPYAHLPVIALDPARHLQIITGERTITITGRALHTLEDLLHDEKLSWIRESPSGIDEGGDLFIAAITVTDTPIL